MKQHNYPHLPQYFAVERDIHHPLWGPFEKWIERESGTNWGTVWRYIGFHGAGKWNGFDQQQHVHHFLNPVEIISLESWKQAIDKTEDMKDTEFKPGEFCRFPNSEIPAILDLLRENGYPVCSFLREHTPNKMAILCDSTDADFFSVSDFTPDETHTEIAPSEFLYKAKRGNVKPYKEGDEVIFPADGKKGVVKSCYHAIGGWFISAKVDGDNDRTFHVDNVISMPEFDSSKPFEVSHDGEHWHEALHYVGRRSNGEHCVEINATLGTWQYIRNVKSFTANMLEVGEYMEITQIGPNENWVVQKMQNGFLYSHEYAEVISNDNLKGRRVKVNITTEEV